VPADEFRQYYAGLSEEGLREIDRADLTDVARACYDDELASRGLTIERDQPVAPADDTPWAALDTLPLSEVRLAGVLLDSAEIPWRVESEGADPGAGQILFVPEPLLEQAREVLGTEISDEELIAQAEAEEPPEDA
jgi:hypothetical protein